MKVNKLWIILAKNDWCFDIKSRVFWRIKSQLCEISRFLIWQNCIFRRFISVQCVWHWIRQDAPSKVNTLISSCYIKVKKATLKDSFRLVCWQLANEKPMVSTVGVKVASSNSIVNWQVKLIDLKFQRIGFCIWSGKLRRDKNSMLLDNCHITYML